MANINELIVDTLLQRTIMVAKHTYGYQNLLSLVFLENFHTTKVHAFIKYSSIMY